MVDEYDNFLKQKVAAILKGCMTENSSKNVPPMPPDEYKAYLDKAHETKIECSVDQTYVLAENFVEKQRRKVKHGST